MEKQHFEFYTEYNQFYIKDKESPGNTASPNFWTIEASNERLATEKGVLGVRTQSYGNIKGEIRLLENSLSEIDYSKYDHIVEGGIIVKSGELQILNCPDNTLEAYITVKSGNYKVRIYSSNFASVKETDLANDTDEDYYLIEVWPSDDMERKVLKQYNNPN